MTSSYDWEQTHRVLPFSWREIAAMLDTTERSLYRWKSGAAAPSPPNVRRLDALQDLARLLDETFGSPARIRAWLETRLPALGNRTPLELLRRGRVEEVQETLGRVVHGVY